MLLSMLLMLSQPVSANVPKANLSPSTIATAKEIEVPIRSVDLSSSAATIQRSAKLKLSSGTKYLKLPALPGAINKDSLRVSLRGAELLRLSPQTVLQTDYSLKELQEIINKLEQLQQKLQELDLELQLAAEEQQMLSQLNPASSKILLERSLTPQISPRNWSIISSFVGNRQQKSRAASLQLQQQRKQILREAEQLKRDALPYQQGGQAKEVTEVIVVISVLQSTTVSLDVSYEVSGSRWAPSYDVHYDSEKQEARIDVGAELSQATGEEWSNVRLTLSNAAPQQRVLLPQLNTWTLGEKSEYIPVVRAARSPGRPSPLPQPKKLATTLDAEREAQREQYQQQVKHLAVLTRNFDAQHLRGSGALGSLGGRGGGGAGIGGLGTKGGPAAPSTVVEFATMEDESPMVGAFGKRSSRSNARRRAAPPSSSKSRKARLLAIDAPNTYRPRPNQHTSVTWVASGPQSIESNGQPKRVPVASFTVPAPAYYESTPALQQLSYLRANVENTQDEPILKGKANIFVDKRYTSQGILQNTASGGKLGLPLGADENISIKRNITANQRKRGLFSAEEITDYTIKIDLVNHRSSTIQMRVFDVLPSTKNAKISITESEKSTPYQNDPHSKGVVFWDVELPPGEPQVVELKYAITRPKNWKLWGKTK